MRDAAQPGVICPQSIIPAPRRLIGKAASVYMALANSTKPSGYDCPLLNVWTQATEAGAMLPVMFWIHGGGQVQGSGIEAVYDGTALANEGVVVVTINYRLGLAEYLVAPDLFDGDIGESSRGFLDQVEALRWVHRNIERFGGDPSNFTMFGESAVATSLSVLLGSPSTQGLFCRAILMSGAVDCGATVDEHQRLAAIVLEKLSVQPGDSAALAAVPNDRLFKAFDQATKIVARDPDRYGAMALGYGGSPSAFGNEFQPFPTIEALDRGHLAEIDLMLGTVRHEARLFTLLLPGPNWLSSRLSLRMFASWYGPGQRAQRLMATYRSAMPGASSFEIREQIVTDAVFRRGTVRAAAAHSKNGLGSTYLYDFDWASPASNGAFAAIHALELGMVLRHTDQSPEFYGDPGTIRDMADSISDCWVNFAKTGVPSGLWIPNWTPFDADRRSSLVLGAEPRIVKSTCAAESKIWGTHAAGATV